MSEGLIPNSFTLEKKRRESEWLLLILTTDQPPQFDSVLPVGISQCVQGVFTRGHSRRDGCNLCRETLHRYTTQWWMLLQWFLLLCSFLTMHVLEFSPMKESLSTCVSLLALNGVWGLFLPSARMHSCRERSNDGTIIQHNYSELAARNMSKHFVASIFWLWTYEHPALLSWKEKPLQQTVKLMHRRRGSGPLMPAGSCWSRLLRGESGGRRWMCPPLSRSLPGQLEKIFRASSPVDAEWSGTQRGSGRSERWLRSDQTSWRRHRKHLRLYCRYYLQQPFSSCLTQTMIPPNVHLQLFPTSISLRTSSVHFTSLSCSPTTCTCCFPSSSTRSLALRFRRSNTFNANTNWFSASPGVCRAHEAAFLNVVLWKMCKEDVEFVHLLHIYWRHNTSLKKDVTLSCMNVACFSLKMNYSVL